MNASRKKLYRQTVVLSEEMKDVLDDYCRMEDIPKSNFIRRAIFKEIARQGNVWKERVDLLNKHEGR